MENAARENRTGNGMTGRVFLALVLAFVLGGAALMASMACAPKALAESASRTFTICAPAKGERGIGLQLDKLKGAKKVSATVGKKGILSKVHVESRSDSEWVVDFTLKQKTGKTTITATGTKGGKKLTEKIAVRVIKHVNPAKSVKVGSKQLAGKFKGGDSTHLKFGSSKALSKKITVKAKSGWKVQSIACSRVVNGEQGGFTPLKNGQTIKLSSSLYVDINFYNKSKNTNELLTIYIDCPNLK